MDLKDTIYSVQQQATAAWIDYLNNQRLNELFESLKNIDINHENASDELKKCIKIIKTELIEKNRGGEKGLHGFISEVAETGIGNARELIKGNAAITEWLNDNGVSDIKKYGVEMQMKFCNKNLSLDAIKDHLKLYPDYIKNGNKYMIPKNHYETISRYLKMSEAEAGRLTKNGELNYKQYKYIKNFFKENNIEFSDIEPSVVEYKDVQKNVIDSTIKHEQKSIDETASEMRQDAYDNSRPTFSEGAKATVTSAFSEGAITFLVEVAECISKRKSIRKLTPDDWDEIAKKTGRSTIRGGVRGVTVFSLTNYTATPSYAASEMVNASFRIADIVSEFRKGSISEAEMIERSEIACLDSCVSCICMMAGAFIPIPLLGSVLTNMVGMRLYNTAKDCLNEYEQTLIKGYLSDISKLDSELSTEYRKHINEISAQLVEYSQLLEEAFCDDLYKMLSGSVAFASRVGVRVDEILDSKEKIDSYFLG